MDYCMLHSRCIHTYPTVAANAAPETIHSLDELLPPPIIPARALSPRSLSLPDLFAGCPRCHDRLRRFRHDKELALLPQRQLRSSSWTSGTCSPKRTAAPPADSPLDARGDCAARDRSPKRHYEQTKAVTRPGPPAARVGTSTTGPCKICRGELLEKLCPARKVRFIYFVQAAGVKGTTPTP